MAQFAFLGPGEGVKDGPTAKKLVLIETSGCKIWAMRGT